MERRWWGLAAIALSMVVVVWTRRCSTWHCRRWPSTSGASTGELQWVVDSYVLVLAALMLPVGALGDRHGRRTGLVAGLLRLRRVLGARGLGRLDRGAVAARAGMGLGAAALTTLGLSTRGSAWSTPCTTDRWRSPRLMRIQPTAGSTPAPRRRPVPPPRRPGASRGLRRTGETPEPPRPDGYALQRTPSHRASAFIRTPPQAENSPPAADHRLPT